VSVHDVERVRVIHFDNTAKFKLWISSAKKDNSY